jgi:hypothetical protein
MTKKKTLTKEKNDEATSTRVWQVVQQRIGLSGAVLEKKKLGTPQTLENAKRIIEYRSTIELRNNVRYKMERLND